MLFRSQYAQKFGDDLDHLPLDTELLGRLAIAAGGGPVLDIGCGPAQAGGFLAARGTRVLGLDLSAGMLATAAARWGGLGLGVACGDLRRLPVRDACCAGVTSFYVLHHVPREDLATALREIRRVLRPGGGLLLATHEGVGEFIANDDLGIQGTLYRRVELERAVAGAGFGKVRVRNRDPLPHERQSGRLYVTATS